LRLQLHDLDIRRDFVHLWFFNVTTPSKRYSIHE
jgi:hypothetical protein